MPGTPYTVGISGGTCSGKSTLADHLAQTLGQTHKITVLHTDDYYQWSKMRTTAPVTRTEYPEHNHPDAIDAARLHEDFAAARSDETNDMILLEGTFALYFSQLRTHLDLKIFIDLPSDERLYRRINRMLDREPLDDIALRYLDTVRYRHNEFVEPTRWHADLVINGALHTHAGTAIVTSYIEAQLRHPND